MREALLVPVGVVMVVTDEAVQQALSKRLRQFRSEKQLKFDEAPFWKWAAEKRSTKLKAARSVSIPKINQGLADAPLTDMINTYMRETGRPGAAAPNVSATKVQRQGWRDALRLLPVTCPKTTPFQHAPLLC